jgi:osmotically-inducible protein OsmY
LRDHFSTLRAVLLAAGASSMLGGCVLAVVGAGAAAGGYTLNQERGPGGVVSDATIKAQINAKWARENSGILSYVNLNVFQGRVLLTGDVPSPDIKNQAVTDVRSVQGINELIDGINIAPRATFSSSAKDNWILTQLNSSLTFDGDIRSLNYSLQCVDGVVYILGIARDQSELDKVVFHARTIPGVVRVVSYIRIRVGVNGGQSTVSAPPQPAPVSAPDGTGMAPGYQSQGDAGGGMAPSSGNYGQAYGGQNPGAPIPLDSTSVGAPPPAAVQVQLLQ